MCAYKNKNGQTFYPSKMFVSTRWDASGLQNAIIEYNSKNVLFAATTAHVKGLKVIGLTGAKDSKLKDMSDVCIKAPQTETYMIQELHLPIYHCLCLMLEDKFYGTKVD